MALDTAFGDLSLRLEQLHDALVGLRLTLVEDKPLEGAGALVDRLGEVALDLEARLGQCLGQARRGQRAAQYPRDDEAARQALSSCHEGLQEVGRELSSEVASFRRIEELTALGRERGGEWTGWVRILSSAVEQCQSTSHDVDKALYACWREMAERAGAREVPVPLPPNVTAKPKRMESHGKQRS
jgi:hypothetical protein